MSDSWSWLVMLLVTMFLSGTGFSLGAQEGPWVSFRPAGMTEVYRVEATPGAIPENISEDLDTLSPRAADIWLNISPDGRWLLMETERWGCTGWACLARVRADFSEGGLVLSGTEVLHPEGFSAISSSGNLIVWVGQGCGTHARDLWLSQFSSGSWDSAFCLTQDATSTWNEQPAISADGGSVLFACDENICGIDTSGNNLHVEIMLGDEPGSGSWSQIRSPDFDMEGNIVFEGEDNGEYVWRQDRLSCNMELINTDYSNDNSPCVLPDGLIASLWLNRPDNSEGLHELKLMNADGTGGFMLVTAPVDVADIGIGCGGFAPKIFSDGFESGGEEGWSSALGDDASRFNGCWRRITPLTSPLLHRSHLDSGEDD